MPLEPDTPARRLFVRVIVAVMATLAVLKLGDEFRRLVLDSGVHGAVDLRLRHAEVAGWFVGQPVYRTLRSEQWFEPPRPGHRQLTDAYLLGLATAHDGRLATFDRTVPLKSVRRAKAVNLEIIQS